MDSSNKSLWPKFFFQFLHCICISVGPERKKVKSEQNVISMWLGSSLYFHLSMNVPSARILRTGHLLNTNRLLPRRYSQQNWCGLWYTHLSTFKWRKVFCIAMYHGLCVPLWSFLADGTKKVAKIWLRHISTLNSSVWSEWVEIFHIGKSIHISSNEDSCRSPTLLSNL